MTIKKLMQELDSLANIGMWDNDGGFMYWRPRGEEPNTLLKSFLDIKSKLFKSFLFAYGESDIGVDGDYKEIIPLIFSTANYLSHEGGL